MVYYPLPPNQPAGQMKLTAFAQRSGHDDTSVRVLRADETVALPVSLRPDLRGHSGGVSEAQGIPYGPTGASTRRSGRAKVGLSVGLLDPPGVLSEVLVSVRNASSTRRPAK